MTAQILNFAIVQPSRTPVQDMEKYLKTLFDKCTQGFVEIRQISAHGIATHEWIALNATALPVFPNNQNIYVGVATRKSQYGEGQKKTLRKFLLCG
ncbi:MAG: hypothetical protein AB2L12_07200 [Smithellaceae bacterium]